MITKGVASVPSPVCNLQQYKPDVSHEDFVSAVVHEFQNNYNIRESVRKHWHDVARSVSHYFSQIQWIDEPTNSEGEEDIQKGMSELAVSNSFCIVSAFSHP